MRALTMERYVMQQWSRGLNPATVQPQQHKRFLSACFRLHGFSDGLNKIFENKL